MLQENSQYRLQWVLFGANKDQHQASQTTQLLFEYLRCKLFVLSQVWIKLVPLTS
jgi:hypothetical protein